MFINAFVLSVGENISITQVWPYLPIYVKKYDARLEIGACYRKVVHQLCRGLISLKNP